MFSNLINQNNIDFEKDPLYGLERKIILEIYDSHFLAVDITNNQVLTFVLPLSFQSFIEYNNLLYKYYQVKIQNVNLILHNFQKRNFILNSFINDIACNNIKKHNELISIARSIVNNEFIPEKYNNNTFCDFELIIENQLIANLNSIHQQIQNPTYQMILNQQLYQKQQEQYLLYNQINNTVLKENENEVEEVLKENENEEVLKENENEVEEVLKENEEFEVKENENEEVLKENENEEVLKENENEEVLKENEEFEVKENETVLKENEEFEVIENEKVLKENEDVTKVEIIELNQNKKIKSNYWLERKKNNILNENKIINNINDNDINNNLKKESLQDILFNDNQEKYYEKILNLLTCIKFDTFNFKNDKRFNNRIIDLKKSLEKNIKRFNNNFKYKNFKINIYTERPYFFVHDVNYQDNFPENDFLIRIKNTLEKKESKHIDIIKNINEYMFNSNNEQVYILHFSNLLLKNIKNILKETSQWCKNKKDELIIDSYQNESKLSFYYKNNKTNPLFLDIILNSNNIQTGDLIYIWY